MEAGGELFPAIPQLSAFSRLPHEILIRIARQLNVRDLRSLRLTSRYTSSVLRVVLARSHFSGQPWEDTAGRLDALSRFPECAAQIRTVRVVSRHVYEDEEQMAHDEAQSDPEPQMWPLTESQWRASEYGVEDLSRRRLVALKPDLLVEALCRLKFLQELDLSWERFPFMSREEMGLDVELALLAATGGSGDSDDEGGDADSELAEQLTYTTAQWQREMFVDLASDMQPLRRLRIAPLMLDGMDQASYLPLINVLFHPLVRLDLVLTGAAHSRDPSLLSKLEDVLEECWVLRELRVDFGGSGMKGQPSADMLSAGGGAERHFPDFLPQTHISNLQHLEIANCVLRLQDFGRLLKRHGSTLRRLALRSVRGVQPAPQSMFEGGVAMATWEDLFHVAHHDLGKLEGVTLRGELADHVGAVLFSVEEEPEERHRRGLGESAGRSEPGPSRARGEREVVDPAPFEAYMVKRGAYPDFTWPQYER